MEKAKNIALSVIIYRPRLNDINRLVIMDSDSTPDPRDSDDDEETPVPSPVTVTNRNASSTATHMSNDSDTTINNADDYEQEQKVSTFTSPYQTNQERPDYHHVIKKQPIYFKHPDPKKSSWYKPPPSTAVNTVAEVREYHLKSLASFGEFNLKSPDVDDLVESDEDTLATQASNKKKAPTSVAATVTAIAQGTLPPLFYQFLNPAKTPNTRPVLSSVKASPTAPENRSLHIYLTAEIVNKANTPDFAGLMRVFDFLNYQVGLNGERPQILVLPSKRKNGAENPITTRWTNNQPARQFYTLYFQGYVARKQPVSTADAKKKRGNDPKLPTATPNTKPNGTPHTMNVRMCVSINRPQYNTLLAATAKTTNTSCAISVDTIRTEFVEKIGWITGSHRDMNRSHWEHFLTTHLAMSVGKSFPFTLHMEAITPPSHIHKDARNRQLNPPRGVEPIQMWRVVTGKDSAQGLSTSLSTLFHDIWAGQVLGQHMHYIPTSASVTPEGISTMWAAAKEWQESTITVKSFGLKPLHDRIALGVLGEPPRSLAFYLRHLHHAEGRPLFHAVEEHDPTPSEIASHGALPVVYLLVHKENRWMAEQIADDVYTALVYTNPLLTKTHLYRDGTSYVTMGDQKREMQVRAEAALAALTLQVAERNYTVVPPPLPPAPVIPPRPRPPAPAYNEGGWGQNRNGWGAAAARAREEMEAADGMPSLYEAASGWNATGWVPTNRRRPADPDEEPTTLGWGQGTTTWDTTRTSPPWGEVHQFSSTENPIDVDQDTTPPFSPSKRQAKKPRQHGESQHSTPADISTSATTVSSLSTLEQRRLARLEHQVHTLQSVLSSLFPDQQEFATATPRDHPSPVPTATARIDPSLVETADITHDLDVYMTPSDDPDTDPAKQAGIEEL